MMLLAQEAGADPDTIDDALMRNVSFFESLSIVGPVAISPFWALFLTSLASNLGIGNDFIVQHPLLGNWITLIVTGVLATVTTIPNLSKLSKPLGLAVQYIEDNAGIVVAALIAITPYIAHYLMSDVDPAHVTLGLPVIPFAVIAILFLIVPYMLVVMAVRYLIDIVAFLSPVPFVDASAEILKKVFAGGFTVLYIFFPPLAFALCILTFIGAFFFYNRARRSTRSFKYLYAKPAWAAITGQERSVYVTDATRSIIENYGVGTEALAIMTDKAIGSIGPKKKAWLVKQGTQFHIIEQRSLRSDKVEIIDGPLKIGKALAHAVIEGDNNKILLNTANAEMIEQVADKFGFTTKGSIGLAKTSDAAKAKFKESWSKLRDAIHEETTTIDRQILTGK